MAHAHIATLDAIDGNGLSDDSRRQTLDAAYALIRRLERPIDTMMQLVALPATNSIFATLLDMKLFERWKDYGIDSPMVDSKLAELTGCDTILISRMLRHLATAGYLTMLDPHTYKTTPFAAALVEPGFRDGILFLSDVVLPAFLQVPEFLKKVTYTNPTDRNDTCFSDYSGVGIFDFLKQKPDTAVHFNELMKVTNAKFSVPWTELYPVDQFAGVTGAIVVDVGGNQGQDLKKLAQLYDLPEESLILQDLPAGLASAELPSSIKPMEHDFFTPQPVKGAKAYYIHRVLHDWPDSDVLKILGHLRDALRPGYSSILIHEMVVSTDKPSTNMTTMDMIMMVTLSGYERTYEMWQKLTEELGMEIAHVYNAEGDHILELVLKT